MIWFKRPTLEVCQMLDKGFTGKGTLMETMGIKVTEIGDDYITATMPAIPAHHNPIGMVHGGANVVLAETVASYAANFVVDTDKYFCVGQEISASHLKASRNGELIATARPLHIGKRSSVWDIEIKNSAGQLCCSSRMTAAVVEKKANFA
ncbi:PaaI family thioesterase [Paraferrimonas sp. SM1919]|uniref:PaaI family thioesterase n=1 Tax=Paraferrimonas sp. SM1919 TaxID=2662263 RepID=UPI0013D0C8D3|nr:hotdog fold thioesterase [Paraferrimonas sp. SM1919]